MTYLGVVTDIGRIEDFLMTSAVSDVNIDQIMTNRHQLFFTLINTGINHIAHIVKNCNWQRHLGEIYVHMI